MKKILLTFLFIGICSQAFAGFNICDNGTSLYKSGTSPIAGCLYFNDDDMAEYTRVKDLYGSVRKDFLKIVGGVVVEKTQAEKDVIVQSEIDANTLSKTTATNKLDVSVKEAFTAFLKVYNSKVPPQYRISGAELVNQLKTDRGL